MFSVRRWLLLVTTDIVLRLLMWIVCVPYFFFLGPLFSCLHLVLLGSAAKFVLRFDLRPLTAFMIIMIVTNMLFLIVASWILHVYLPPLDFFDAVFAFVGFGQIVFNIFLVSVFWLDKRINSDTASGRWAGSDSRAT